MNRYLIGGIATVLIASAASYAFLRGDPIKDMLNKKWPPVNAEIQRQKAVDSASTSLASLTVANLALGLDAKTLVALVEPLLKPLAVESIQIKTEQQLLHLDVDFHRVFGPEQFPNDLKGRELIVAAAPDIAGTVVLSLGVAADVANGASPSLRLHFLPAVERLHVKKLTLAQKIDASIAADALAFVLNRYADNLTSKLGEASFLEMSVPAALPAIGGQSGLLKISIPSAPDIKVTLSAKPISNTLRLGSVASLIDDDHISIITQLVPAAPASAASTPAAITNATFGTVKAAFGDRLKSGLDMASIPSTGVWITVSKAFMAQALNDAFDQAKPCFSAQGPVPTQNFSKKVEIPDETTIQCDPSDNCDLQTDERNCRHAPNCTHNHDDRDCSGLGKFACEIAKAAQNQEYDRAFDLCNAGAWIDDQACEAAKATQNGLYAKDKLACETAKSAKKGACETAKETVKRISRTGNFANLDGSMGGPANLNLCLNDVRFGNDLGRVSMNLAVAGGADVASHLKFVPLDIVGHLACPAEWTDNRTIKASIPAQTIPVSATVASRMFDGRLSYTGRVDDLTVKLHFDPSPTVILLRNANFTLACLPLAGLINAVTLNLGPLIPELLKDFDYKQKATDFSFAPQLPVIKMQNHEWSAAIEDSPQAVKLVGPVK